MAKHTSGPWAATTRRGSWDWVVYQVSDSNIEVCQPFHDGTEMNETGEANARLIAAAPDLLEVAQNALACLRHTHDRLSNGPEFETLRITINQDVRALKAAIAKAEGSTLSSAE